MKAIKCDRCGKFFEAEKGYYFGKVGDYKVAEYYIDTERSHYPFEREVDLCDDCQKALREFMKGGEKQ